jgi:glutamate-ammonia-ligase adenylyltransferase
MKKMAELNPYGYLYKMDARLRPDGAQGLLAISFDSFVEYHRHKGALWEKRAMTKQRAVAGDVALGKRLTDFTRGTIYDAGFFSTSVVDDAVMMLDKIIEAVEDEDREGIQIKNAEGGIVEIEFLVQLLQLRHGPGAGWLRTTNTMEALDLLVENEFISRKAHEDLSATLALLRRVENRLRLMHDRSLNELPSDPDALDKLALRLDVTGSAHQSPGEALGAMIESYINRSHRVFEKQIERFRRAE